MRWSWALAILIGSAGVAPIAESRPDRTRGQNFWREIVDPHGEEIQAILAKARDVIARPEQAMNADTDWAVEQRARFYRDAYHMLAYARRLAPQHVEVLALYGRVADELGLTREAKETFEACAKLTGLDKLPHDVASRLGTIYLRLGETDRAIRWLRLAQGPLTPASVSATVHLASILAARGEIARATDVLTNAMPTTTLGHYTNELTMTTFALAVLYDRDEQRTAASVVLHQMQTALQQQYGVYVLTELAKLRFAHPEDLHYYRGLLYESLGHYPEARAEWAHYAAAGDTPWRRRALGHIAELDAQRRAAPAKPAAAVPPPTGSPQP